MALSDIVQVSISLRNAAVVAAGFGVPLIAGPSNRFAERYQAYGDQAEMLEAGFASSDPEYVAAGYLMSQAQAPEQFLVGRRLTEVAQVDTITPTVVNLTEYTVTINGTDFDFTSDGSATAAEIVNGLLALINADVTIAAILTATNVANTLVLTADVAGQSFTTSVGANLAMVHTTANVGIAEDLAAFRAAGAIWYGTLLTSRNSIVIKSAAAWIEANSSDIPVIGINQSSESTTASAALDPVGTDLGNVLAARDYTRTALMWHGTDGEYADCAWAGGLLPFDPGTETWALKSLVGVTPDDLTTTQKNNMIGADVGQGKNVNIYYSLTPQNAITERGTMSSGDWIDVIRTIDWLKARISEAIANVLLTLPKVPFDDDGIQLLAGQVIGVLQGAETQGVLAKSPKFTVTAPRAADISGANKTARKLDPPIEFTATLSGAIHNVEVSGEVTE